MHAQGEHANSTQKEPTWDLNQSLLAVRLDGSVDGVLDRHARHQGLLPRGCNELNPVWVQVKTLHITA